jgi:putative ATPase
MLEAGEDPRFIARRIVILASEDVGNADPRALSVATAAWQAVEMVGLPECQLNLAQAVIYLATAPKSNSATEAISKARKDVREGRTLPVPKHLRDASYRGAKTFGHGEGYEYSHDFEGAISEQEFLPEERRYYEPTDRGFEAEIQKRLAEWRRLRRQGEDAEEQPGHAEEPPAPERAEERKLPGKGGKGKKA